MIDGQVDAYRKLEQVFAFMYYIDSIYSLGIEDSKL